MPASVLSKGLRAGWTEGESGWGDLMNDNLERINAWINQAFANNPETTIGLTYGYKGGPVHESSLVIVPDGTIALTALSTNYVQRSFSGTVEVSTTGWTGQRIPMAVVVTDGVGVTSITDARQFVQIGASGTLLLRAVQFLMATTHLIIPDVLNFRNSGDTANLAQLTQAGDFAVLGRLNGLLNASSLDMGTVPAERMIGAYELITRVGLLDQLAVNGAAYTTRLNRGDVSGALTFDASLSNVQRIRLVGNVSGVGISNMVAGQVMLLEIEQDSTGGRLITWGGGFRPESGVLPELSTVGGDIDLVSIYYNGTSYLIQHGGSGF